MMVEASVREGERTREPRSVNGNNDRGSPRRSPCTKNQLWLRRAQTRGNTPPCKRPYPTFYGIGFIVATVVIGELGDLRRFRKARQLTAFAGVSPRIYQSGTSVNGRPRMCKKGSPRIRHVLYLAALTAVRANNDLQHTYQRLLDQRKPPMVATGTVTSKLLVVMRAMLITETPCDPDRQLNRKRQPICP